MKTKKLHPVRSDIMSKENRNKGNTLRVKLKDQIYNRNGEGREREE